MKKINRRSFLKLAGLTLPAVLFPQISSLVGGLSERADASKPNVIVLLFDAMSARNLSVYGYPRLTTPSLEKFAGHANVYHSHYSGGNFTIPGVSSLLTGTVPWTHRAINTRGMVAQHMVEKNIFRAIQNGYTRLAFPQNAWANLIVSQFADDIDTFLLPTTYGEMDYLVSDFFPNDLNSAMRSLDDFAFKEYEQASLVFGSLINAMAYRSASRLSTDGYPRGVPYNENFPMYFRLEDVFDGLSNLLPNLTSPTFAYIHLFPPHAPYRPTSRFYGNFADKWHPEVKPDHVLSQGSISVTRLASARRGYDEYIASVDWELGNLFDVFEREGVFENSYVIVTADHGEMFERGFVGHVTPLLSDPVVHIPLLISAPGQKSRRDFHAPTHAVDLLPTIASLTENPIPMWCEGELLSGFGGMENYKRSTFTIEAKKNSAFGPLTKASICLRKGTNKLVLYTGYTSENIFELYDLETDSEEMFDLYPSRPSVLREMKEELLDALSDANKPYMKNKEN